MKKSADALVEEARIWAQIDGCEGGDLLVALASALEMAHYSYADQEKLEARLMKAITSEIREHRKMATGPDSDAYGYEEEDVQWALREIALIGQ